MRRFRFSIASLLSLVLFVAIGFAALRAATDAWDSGILAATLLALLIAVLFAVHRTGERRTFWVGFGLFGWAYLVASLVPPIESRLPTTGGLAYLASKVSSRTNSVIAVAFSPEGRTLATSSHGAVRLWDATTGTLLAGPNGTTENFVRIGHSLMALVLAFAGGHLSRHLSTGNMREQTPEARAEP